MSRKNKTTLISDQGRGEMGWASEEGFGLKNVGDCGL